VSASTPFAPLDSEDTAPGATPRPAPRSPADSDPEARDVVVGVDGSECGLAAARWAAGEAARRGAPLRIVHAATYLGSAASGQPSPELPRARHITAQAYTVARRAEHGLTASTEVIPDEPVAALLRAGAAAQLLVLGSSATGAPDEMILAPVALRVAARSPHPVTVVPRQRGSSAAGRPVVAVLGVGDADDDTAVAEYAAAAAGRSRTRLSILQTRSAGRGTHTWADDLEQWRARYPDLDVERTDLPRADGGDLLAAAGPSPLLVMSTGPGNWLHRSLDAPHRWLLRHCTSPLALVPQVHGRNHADDDSA
jgi:nucleotide-binding universal stress UspA family protein